MGSARTGKTQKISAPESNLIVIRWLSSTDVRAILLYEVQRRIGEPPFQIRVHLLDGGTRISALAARTLAGSV